MIGGKMFSTLRCALSDQKVRDVEWEKLTCLFVFAVPCPWS
jgi:hypothetical protein